MDCPDMVKDSRVYQILHQQFTKKPAPYLARGSRTRSIGLQLYIPYYFFTYLIPRSIMSGGYTPDLTTDQNAIVRDKL